MQSILSAIQERHQNGSQILSKNGVKEGYHFLGSKTFILTCYSENCVNGMLLLKQMIDYTNAISDSQIEMVLLREAVPSAFIAVSHTDLFAAYQGIYKDKVLSSFDAKNAISPKTETKAEEISTIPSLSSIAKQNSLGFTKYSPVSSPRISLECQSPSQPLNLTSIFSPGPEDTFQFPSFHMSNLLFNLLEHQNKILNQQNLQQSQLLTPSLIQRFYTSILNPMLNSNLLESTKDGMQKALVAQTPHLNSNVSRIQKPHHLFLSTDQLAAISLQLQKSQIEDYQKSANLSALLSVIKGIH
jgi:hypothetical protein